MKTALAITLSAAVLALLCAPPHSFAQGGSACVGCHTDEGALKSLYKPPKIEGGEGEG